MSNLRGHAGRAWARMWPYVPGLAVVLGIYLLTVLTGGRFLYEERFNAMQALDVEALAADPVGSLMALHSQPPLMNVLFAATSGEPTRLQLVLLACVLITVALVTDTVWRAGRGPRSAAAAGLLYGLLPASVLYSLFPYSTTLTALWAIVAVWGIGVLRTRPAWGAAATAAGALGLFVTRASFVWPLVICWLIAAGLLLVRRTRDRSSLLPGLGALLVAGSAVIALQSHYWSSFHVPTLSSWSGENQANALLKVGLTNDAKAALAAREPCFADLVAVGAWGPIDAYPDCVSKFDAYPRGARVLDLTDKTPPSVGTNFNAGARVALGADWSRFVRAALIEHPESVWRIVVGDESTEGSLALFLGRSDVYYETLDLQKATQPWLWHLLGLWSGAFPFVAWSIVALAVLRGVVQRGARQWLLAPFWFAVFLLVAHAVPSVVGDLGENNRFRAELDPVLMAAMVIGLGSLVRVRRFARTRRSSSAEQPLDA